MTIEPHPTDHGKGTGEPDELKGSRPVRWGAVAKVLVWQGQQLGGGLPNNKIYPTDELALVLEAHGKDDHETLIAFASEHTRGLWTKTFTQRTRTVEEARASLQLWARLAFQPAHS